MASFNESEETFSVKYCLPKVRPVGLGQNTCIELAI